MGKVSVIIPVYNAAAYLPRCLDSILRQSYQELEIILVNDGSIDDSPQLCDYYAAQDERIVVIHQENRGSSAAKNVGLDTAIGDYIGFLDSDDWIALDMYAYLLDLLEQNAADIAEIMLDVAYSEDHVMRQPVEQIQFFIGDDKLIRYFEHNEFAMGLRLYKREIFTELRFDLGRMNEDVVAGFLALKAAQKLVVSNQLKYFYFSNPFGLSESPLRKRDFDLLYAGARLDELTSDVANEKLRKLALTKKYRAPFTLLAKMALFGCSAELHEKQTKQELQRAVRSHYGFLMSSNMPVNRKLLLTASCFSYPLVKGTARIFRAFRLRALRRRNV